MENTKTIEKIFTSKTINEYNEMTYGFTHGNFVYALYSDGTWELLVVYDGFYWGESEINRKFNAANRLRGKTKAKAIEIIEQMMENGYLNNAHLLCKKIFQEV